LAIICWLGAATPGPSLVVILRISLSQGTRVGLLAAWSHAFAIGIYALFALLFFSVFQAAGALWFYTLVVMGQLWLLWLGGSLLWQRLNRSLEESKPALTRFSQHWSQGFFIGVLNPKIWLFFTAVFSPFVRNLEASLFSLALLPLLIDGLWYSLITLAVNRPRWAALLNRSEHGRDTILGIILILFAAVALFDTLPQWVSIIRSD
jgi:threonine/homoserine/homoserine lactone efflux protein